MFLPLTYLLDCSYVDSEYTLFKYRIDILEIEIGDIFYRQNIKFQNILKNIIGNCNKSINGL